MNEPAAIRRSRAARVLHRYIAGAYHRARLPVQLEALHVGGEPIGLDEVRRRPFVPFRVGDAWGPDWDTTWFRVRGSVPAEWAGERVVLVVRLGYTGGTGFGAEGLVWREGEPLQGVSPNHDEVVLFDPALGGDAVDVLVEAAANPQVLDLEPPPMYLPDYGGAPKLRLAACHLAVVEREVQALWEDWSLLLELSDALPADQPRAARVLRVLDRAGAVLDPQDVRGTAGASRAVLAPALASPAHASAHRYLAVGNAHIDSAWLWPVRETRRKVARTFSTVLALMEEYPDYRFAASQAQQLAWLREDHPGLFERVRRKVEDGQFEVVGSMWVEADCNIPSGESLVRQIVHGKRFFLDEFGVDTDNLWLPDVFGYPANLPQLLAQSGIGWFLTQKISWNQVNHFPHHTFWWQGIDGTRVLTHFPPADTYNGDFSMGQLTHGVSNFAQKDLADHSMYLYGWGDGGGGPTRHMLERARRLADLEGAPRVELSGAAAAFRALEEDAPLDELPVWAGELYLEMHRGTYTTHGEVKRANRRTELALRDAELWSVAAARLGVDYPVARLDAAWKRLMLHQFHDIIPGSSIHWVYRDTATDHAALAGQVERIVEEATSAVAAAVGGPGVVVFNPLGFARSEVVDLEEGPVLLDAPACGWRQQQPRQEPAGTPGGPAGVRCGPDWMDNGILRVSWDGDGLLTSVLHHPSGREALAPGTRANLLQLHDDRPVEYDAWDVDAVAFQSAMDLTAADEVVLEGAHPLRAGLRVVRTFGSSRIEQEVVLRAGSPFVEVRSVVEWHESHRLLKAAFPVAVHAERAAFEVQFGHIHRPTHANTSWDEARFEVCAHTWIDLSEPGFGVALINDCKYGHDVRGGVMRLTLLRSPTWPDPLADRGRHEFVYCLMPHGPGDPVSSGVVAAAHALNSPLRVVQADGPADQAGGGAPASASLFEVDDPAAVITAVKQADAGPGTVVRLYEAAGGHRRVRVRPVRAGAEVVGTPPRRVDLLERPWGPPVASEAGAAVVDLSPFEVVTLLFA